jgi:hypothetical protein
MVEWKVGDWAKLGNRVGQIYEIKGNLLLVNQNKGWVWEDVIYERLEDGSYLYDCSDPEYVGTIKPRVNLPCIKSEKPVGWVFTPIFVDGKVEHYELTRNTKL